MSSNPTRTLLLDCDNMDNTANLLSTLSLQHANNGEVINIYAISSKSSEKCLEFVSAVNSIKSDNKVASVDMMCSDCDVRTFYEFKCKIDQQNIKNIHIFTSVTRRSHWMNLCDIFLTPVYDWSLSCGDEHYGDTLHDNLSVSQQNDVTNFLKKLPYIGDIELLRSSMIPGDDFSHAYHTRQGGISRIEGMRSLNMLYTSKKKDPEVVIQENRRRLSDSAGFNHEKIVTTKAVHGGDIWRVGARLPEGGFDGIITNTPGITLAAPGADCIVLVFADPVKRACGACHAGWRGTLEGVAPNTVNALVREYGCDPVNIRVVMGPSIGKCCFRLGPDDASRFTSIHPSCTEALKEGNISVDLQKANRILLENAGIHSQHIDDITLTSCTCCTDNFFSYQRDGVPFGNQMGFICVKE